MRVTETGVGLPTSGRGLETGLTNLRERLRLAFGADIEMTLSPVEPHGVRAELAFPAQEPTR